MRAHDAAKAATTVMSEWPGRGSRFIPAAVFAGSGPVTHTAARASGSAPASARSGGGFSLARDDVGGRPQTNCWLLSFFSCEARVGGALGWRPAPASRPILMPRRAGRDRGAVGKDRVSAHALPCSPRLSSGNCSRTIVPRSRSIALAGPPPSVVTNAPGHPGWTHSARMRGWRPTCCHTELREGGAILGGRGRAGRHRDQASGGRPGARQALRSRTASPGGGA
jgi:hypothetical protein